MSECQCYDVAGQAVLFHSSHSLYYLEEADMAMMRSRDLMLARVHVFPLDAERGEATTERGRPLVWERRLRDHVAMIHATVDTDYRVYDHKDLSAMLLASRFNVSLATAYPALQIGHIGSDYWYQIHPAHRVTPVGSSVSADAVRRCESLVARADPTSTSAITSVTARMSSILECSMGCAREWYERLATDIHARPPPVVDSWQDKRDDYLASAVIALGLGSLCLTLLIYRPLRVLSWMVRSILFTIFCMPLICLALYLYQRWERETVRGSVRVVRAGVLVAVADWRAILGWIRSRAEVFTSVIAGF
jgi:hypothetical protein